MNHRNKEKKPPVKPRQNIKGKATLGPISNLEAHLHSDWWRRIFNAYYLKTDADVVEDQAITTEEIDSIVGILQPDKKARILDLCCGQGRHTLELFRRGYVNVEGLDRSHSMINRARNIARKEGLNLRFREGDARRLPYPSNNFDFVLVLGNSFGYFETVQDDLRVLREILRILRPFGKILMDNADGEYLRSNFQPRSWEWIDDHYFVCRERSLSSDNDRIITREIISHVDKGIRVDQFYAERLYTRESLTALLTSVGFERTVFPSEIVTESQRAQDLGMMERRIIVTADAKKEIIPAKVTKLADKRHVLVLLGDPSISDPLKPDAVFDADDLYTVDEMKKELSHLDEFQVSFQDNHHGLVQDLQNAAGKIDLVFNLLDEGFYNDPRKELHVAAMLEMLSIKYTGAGPQCLAYCYDKSLVRGIATEMNIPVAEGFFIKTEDITFELTFPFPVIVKPNFGDSSFGITQRSVCYTIEELVNVIAEIREKFGYDKPILVEEFLTGKDISVGIIGNPFESYRVLPIIEEDYSELPPDLPRICGYEAKWLPDSPYWKIRSKPVEMADDMQRMMVDCCLKLFELLECRDYARFDWRLDAQDNPKLLEVNPNPGWCWDGHLAKMAKLAGISYGEMLKMIIDAAERRYTTQDNIPQRIVSVN